MALATGNRVSELSSIHHPAITFRENGAQAILPVKPGFLYKNQRPNRAPPNIAIRELRVGDHPHALCPIAALKMYLTQSAGLRQQEALFIHPSTGNNLQRPSISGLLCRVIEEACPGSLPKAHNIRKQSVSLAWCRGVSPEDSESWLLGKLKRVHQPVP